VIPVRIDRAVKLGWSFVRHNPVLLPRPFSSRRQRKSGLWLKMDSQYLQMT
jgi:hypothetical protein